MKKWIFITACSFLIPLKALTQDIPSFPRGNIELYAGPVRLAENDAHTSFFNSGFTAGIGINAFSSRRLQLILSLNYHRLYLNKDNYLQYDPTGKDALELKDKPLEFISFAPLFRFSPWYNSKISTHLLGGLGALQGISDGRVQQIYSNQTLDSKYGAGFRLMVILGAGIQYAFHKRFNVLLEARQHWEFLENTNPGDLFYNFKEAGRSYSYLSLCAGVAYKINIKSEAKDK